MNANEFIKTKVTEEGSQSAVARKIGVRQPTVHKWILGDAIPDTQSLKLIATAYGLPLAYFLEEDGQSAQARSQNEPGTPLTEKQRILLELTRDEDLLDEAIKHIEKEKHYKELQDLMRKQQAA